MPNNKLRCNNMALKIGLIISILLGITIALFPLYSDQIAPYIWGNAEFDNQYRGNENEITITGKIQEIDTVENTIIIDGQSVKINGYWLNTQTDETLYADELLSTLSVGDNVVIYASSRGHWGLMAEKIILEDRGITFIRSED